MNQPISTKDPTSGHTSAAVYIQRFQVNIQKRITNYASVFTTELIAILLAIQWVEEVKPIRAVICSDSMSALNSLSGDISTTRQELIYEILINLLRIQKMGIVLRFMWVPAHVGVQGNETVDKLAKQAMKHMNIEVQIPLSKAEIKGIIKEHINKKWQEMWDREVKGRHLSKSTAGGRSFSYLAPKLWNNLPNTVREADTLCQFKSRLKTHLFNLAYT